MSVSQIEETMAAAGYAKVIVSLKEDALRPAGAAAMDAATVEGQMQNFFIVPSETQAESLATASVRAASKRYRRPEPLRDRRVRIYPHLGLALGFVDARGAAALDADKRVRSIDKAPELSLIRPVARRSAKAAAEITWGIQRLGADRLWDAGITGKGVTVGHLDTGIDGDHPALAGAIGAFAEFDMAGDRVPGAKPWDSDDHGTHTAGTIVGRATRGRAFGVAPEAQVASAMVIEGGQVIDRILGGMDWVIERKCPILSMSLGLRGYTPAFQIIVDALRNANVLPVIAVGNEYANTSRSPGNYANVLSVGAMNAANRVADFSGSQRFDRPDDALVPDLVAPGVGVLSCVPDRGHIEMDGSSMATPHVAGLAALLLHAKPDATAEGLERAILGSCSRPSTMPQARANRGVPDAVEAYYILTGQRLKPARGGAAGGRRRVASAAKTRKKESMPVKASRKRPQARKAAGKGKAAAKR